MMDGLNVITLERLYIVALVVRRRPREIVVMPICAWLITLGQVSRREFMAG